MKPNPVDEPVTIHFKEDSIPSLRRGVLTRESKQSLLAEVLKVPEMQDEIDNLDPKEKINRVEYAKWLATRNLLRAQLRKAYTELFGGEV